MSLTFAVPHGMRLRRRPIRSPRRERATRTAWSATVPRDSTARHPRQQRPSIDQLCAPDSDRRQDLWGPTARRLNIQPPTGGQCGRATFGWWDRPLVVVTDACRRLCSASPNTEGVSMAFEVGQRVVAESESTDRRPRSGVVEEVVRGDPSPRYRIRWDDGHESIYTPASGALRAEHRPKRQRRAAAPKR
jgi:hypothetical protein